MAEKLTTLAKRLRPFINGQVGAIATTGAYMQEGPGIDLVGNKIGIGGDTILLYNSDGTPVEEFPATGAGLTQAVTAAVSGDMIMLPSRTITMTAAITIAAGVEMRGVDRTTSILQATTDLGTVLATVSGVISNVTIYYTLTGHNGGVWLRCATIASGGLATLCSGESTNTGNTPAVGLDVQADGTSSRSDFTAKCTNGTATGIRNLGLIRYNKGRAYGSTTGIGITTRDGGTSEFSAGYAQTSSTMVDLYVPSGTGILRHCIASASGILLVESGATVKLYANQYDTLTNAGKVEYEYGDRQAFHWYDVRLFGAKGDGTTDDTTAIAAAITAIPAIGGVLYFPAGTYLTSGGFTLNKAIKVRGDGAATAYGTPAATSKITCNSRTAILFNVTAFGCSFTDLMMINTAGLQPTAGAGIQITAGGDLMQFDNLYVDGFYIDIDAQDGWAWNMKGCWIYNPVKYGLKMAHADLPDGGNQNIVNSYFMVVQSVSSNTPDAMIRIESGGAPKITNCKINSDAKSTYGIEISPPQNIQTSIFQISNTSIENIKTTAIYIHSGAAPSSWYHIIINGCHFGLYNIGAGGRAIDINATTSGDLDDVIISSNIIFTSGGNPANEAISLTNINHGRICGNYMEGWTGLALETTCTDITYCASTSDIHDSVTLGVDADTILGLTGQQIDLKSQSANLVFAGPTSGGAADPTFRALVATDLPAVTSANLPYGSFSSSATQTIANATTAYAITYTDREVTNQVTQTDNSRINILVAGTYLITFSAVGKSAVANKYLDIWLAVDGTNIARSNTHSKFVGSANERIITVTYIYDFTAGQYFELYMHSDDTGTTIAATAAGINPTRPASPSIIVTVNKISDANTEYIRLTEAGGYRLTEAGGKRLLEH